MATSIKLKFMSSRIEGKEGVLSLQLIHNRKVRVRRTRFRIFSEEWDRRTETVIVESAAPERQTYLQSVQAGLQIEQRELGGLICLLEQKSEYTVGELMDMYNSNSFNGYLFPFVSYIVKFLKGESRYKTATILLTAKSSFERFHGGQDILIENIDNDLMRKYENWMKTTGVVKNTVSCYMRSLRSLYNQAVKRGLAVQKNPFMNVFTRIDKTVKRAVNEDVIVQLKNMNLASQKELALARDLFMFSFYLRGISFVDMANLRRRNIKDGYIVYFRSKTRQQLSIRIEACMQEIISRYEDQTVDDFLLPVYTLQNCDYNSQLRNYNKRLQRISAIMELRRLLSSYVSRHSWATIALRKGISIEIISEGMGHDNETTTRIYLASMEQSVVDNANANIIRLD